jgi:hypothetical protein
MSIIRHGKEYVIDCVMEIISIHAPVKVRQ